MPCINRAVLSGAQQFTVPLLSPRACLLPAPHGKSGNSFPRQNTQVKVLKQRAIELKKEGRTAEAMACLKRAKSLEADLLRDAQGKGLMDKSEAEGGDLARRPSLLRQSSSRRSSAAAVAEPAARTESRYGGMVAAVRSFFPDAGLVAAGVVLSFAGGSSSRQNLKHQQWLLVAGLDLRYACFVLLGGVIVIARLFV